MIEDFFGQKSKAFLSKLNTAILDIVVSLTCTAYHYSSFIVI